jgi:general secretion pathway protein C
MGTFMRVNIEQIFKKWLDLARDFVADPAINLGKARTFLILLAITILSYETIDLFYKVIGISLTSTSAAVKNTGAADVIALSERSSLESYDIITERNLFLTTLKTTTVKEGGFLSSGEEVAEFDLKGTIAGGDSFGFVIIEERGSKKQRLYRLGDMIGSTKVTKISRNTATIRRGGRDITIKIKATPEGTLLNSSRALLGRPASLGMAMSKSEVSDKLRDLQGIMTHAQVRPYFEAGVQQGFIVSHIKPDSLYQKLGLQNGDIIIDVNNKRMQSADDVMNLVNLMQSGESIVVNLKRQGKVETINYSFH